MIEDSLRLIVLDSSKDLGESVNNYIKKVRNTEKEIGRNDPCPCGSGKKYKNCCGKNE